MGRNCIAEVLKSSPRRLVEVYTSQKPHSDALYTELKKKKIAIKHITKKELSKMVQSESHQAYIAAVKERVRADMNSFLERSYDRDNSIVLMLNSIYDPQNLGAIIRAGECFGVDLVVYSKNRGADITPVTTKTSAGATELVPIVKVSNLVETMKRFHSRYTT
jgi:23S rRNA (guanosine2251-2'-O)-methyltransferase